MRSGDTPSSGFAAVANLHINTLILGSLPGKRSIEVGQYYGHPRNAFWKIMGELLDAGPDKSYAERVQLLLAANIGIWDVLASSVRPGSLDADIDLATATPNDFHTFFRQHSSVSRICFNGRAAASLFRRWQCLPVSMNDIVLIDLPSTSPAYAAMSFADKLERWSVVSRPIEAVR